MTADRPAAPTAADVRTEDGRRGDGTILGMPHLQKLFTSVSSIVIPTKWTACRKRGPGRRSRGRQPERPPRCDRRRGAGVGTTTAERIAMLTPPWPSNRWTCAPGLTACRCAPSKSCARGPAEHALRVHRQGPQPPLTSLFGPHRRADRRETPREGPPPR